MSTLGLPWVDPMSTLGLPWVDPMSTLSLPWVDSGSAHVDLRRPWVQNRTEPNRQAHNLEIRLPGKFVTFGRGGGNLMKI